MQDGYLIEERNKKIEETYLRKRKEGYDHDFILNHILPPMFWLKPRTLYGIISGEFDRNKKKRRRNE